MFLAKGFKQILNKIMSLIWGDPYNYSLVLDLG